MKVLQLSSDWKWTGPAEPMLRLAEALRTAGHEVACAYPQAEPDAARSLDSEAVAEGFGSVAELERRRGAHPWRDRRDARRLRTLLMRERFDVVHCWHTRDHLLAWVASGGRRRRIALVRSYRSAEPIPPHPWNRWLFGAATDGLLCVSPETARRNARLRGGRPLAGALGAVDLARFRPVAPRPALRAGLGLPDDALVVGVVARAQRQRRFELLLAAAQRLFACEPRARLLVVGRGTHRAELVERPARELGIADRVVFAGYRTDDYVDVLRAIDVLSFLVPGSDGSCRAVLEAAACGIPAVATRRGALPEIVRDGETGLLVDESAEALAAAWTALLADPARRAAFGAAARRRAESCFAPERLRETAVSIYEQARALRAAPARRAGTRAPGAVRDSEAQS